jgi:TolB protein
VKIGRKIQVLMAIVAAVLSCPANVHAVLTIDIAKQAEGAGIPIAIVPFGAVQGAGGSVDIGEIVAKDLERTGKFNVMPATSMPGQPHDISEIDYAQWKNAAMENLVVGKATSSGAGYAVRFQLVDVFAGNHTLGYDSPTASGELRRRAHQIADMIYEKLTGQKGVADTRVAYVTVQGGGAGKQYALQVADSDGASAQTLFSSAEPIMSPAWSPDGRRLAYASFEERSISIYVQDVGTGSRQRVAGGAGAASAPAFSPDGQSLALAMSKDGNYDIYVMGLGSGQMRQVTDNAAIDTEPSWSPDGSRLIFTSDRGGTPQVYEVSVSGGPAKRITFQGSFNARPSYSPDGKLITMVHSDGGAYQIAVQDVSSGQVRTVTHSSLDETPRFAPNGSMILYSSGGTELGAVSVDGKVRQRLSSPGAEVREPAWGPIQKQ